MKLNEEQVRAIFASTSKQVDLAKQYGVTRGMVTSIKNGRSWKHLDLKGPGRSDRARNNPDRLFSHQVGEIRAQVAGNQELATKYGVPVDIIQRIKDGVTWYWLYHKPCKTKRKADGTFFKYQLKEIINPMYTSLEMAERYMVSMKIIEEVRDADREAHRDRC